MTDTPSVAVNTNEGEAWATIRVRAAATSDRTSAGTAAGEDLDVERERLELLAACIADWDEVGGVETRDPELFTEGPEFPAVERPELLIYTEPAAAAAVEASARALATRLGQAVHTEVREHAGEAWRDVWKQFYRPLHIVAVGGGAQLRIRPSWLAPLEEDAAELVLDPGRAFGTGLHESTRLCLQALVELAAAGLRPRSVVDLGCGSGILGLAALRLFPGLESVTLADHDSEALATAAENAEHNRLRERIELTQVDLTQTDRVLPAAPRDRAELILANIRPKVLIPAAELLTGWLAPGGTLVLSGILDEEAAQVRAAYAQLERVDAPREGGWTAWVLRAKGAAAG